MQRFKHCGAGLETTAHSLAWTLYCVSQHKEVEEKIVAELGSLGLLATPGNPFPRKVEWEDLSKMPYLDAVIKVMPPASPSAISLLPPVCCCHVDILLLPPLCCCHFNIFLLPPVCCCNFDILLLPPVCCCCFDILMLAPVCDAGSCV